MKHNVVWYTLIFAILLTGCFHNGPEQYTFRQGFEQIVTIEILERVGNEFDVETEAKVLRTLDEIEHQGLINALLAADGNRITLGPPGTDFGQYIIRITYQDGEVELIGNYNNGYISPEGVFSRDIYAFNRAQYREIISDFLGYDVTG